MTAKCSLQDIKSGTCHPEASIQLSFFTVFPKKKVKLKSKKSFNRTFEFSKLHLEKLAKKVEIKFLIQS